MYSSIYSDSLIDVYFPLYKDNTINKLELPLISNEIEDIISYYTIYQNMTPLDYYSPFANSTILTNYNIDNKDITLEFNSYFYISNDLLLCYKLLSYSYTNLGYENVFLKKYDNILNLTIYLT